MIFDLMESTWGWFGYSRGSYSHTLIAL